MWQPQAAVTRHSKQTNINHLRLMHHLAEVASATGEIDPAPNQTTLAGLMNVSDRTIRNWIDDLIDSGELIRTRRGRGEGNPSAYQINLPMPVTGSYEETGELTGNYEETNPAFVSGNYEERIAKLEEAIMSLFPVITGLQEKLDELTGITGKVNRKAPSFKSADDPFRSILDPEEEKKKEEEGIPPTPQLAEPDLQTVWDDIQETIVHFEKLTGIKRPYGRSDKAKTRMSEDWITPVHDMKALANGRTEELMRRAVEEMTRDKLTIGSPRSINTTFCRLHREAAQKTADNPHADMKSNGKGW